MYALSVWLQKMIEPFENLAVNIDELPTLEEENFKNISPDYRKVSIIAWGVFYFLLLIGPPIAFTFSNEIKSEFIYYVISISSTLILWSINLIIIFKAFKKKKYLLRQRDLVYCKGLLWTKRTTIPFNRIQHAEVKQGPIERWFKLHNLKVFTAGGSSSDLSIPGLTENKAIKLKEFILNKIEDEQDATD